MGGAVYVAGGTTTFNNVTLANNEAGELGGAVYVDNGTVAFHATKGNNLVFEANKSATNEGSENAKNLLGHTGDFMYMHGNTEKTVASFDIAESASITVKNSIVAESSVGNVAVINKTGKGALAVEDMSGFVGNLNVNAGTMNVTGGIAEFDVTAQKNVNGGKKATDDGTKLVATTVTVGTTTTCTFDKPVAELTFGDVNAHHVINFDVKKNGALTLNSLTVGSSTYTQVEAPASPAKPTTETFWGNVTVTGNATISEGLNVLKSTAEDANTTDKGTLKVTSGQLTINGDSKNDGTIELETKGGLVINAAFTNGETAAFAKAAGATDTFLTIGKTGSFVNGSDNVVDVDTLTVNGVYKSNKDKTTATNIVLNKDGKFVFTDSTALKKYTVDAAHNVDFKGGNLYNGETAFGDELEVAGTATFADDYTFKKLTATGTVTIEKGTLTVTEALTSAAKVNTGVEGILSVSSTVAGLTIDDSNLNFES